ncbi:MAG TPA: protein kinase, partial [Gemmataceae bacterium]|nr:protein kinase [Gemmataceae bacterium]
MPGYEIHGELGRGGMGVVYKARQRGLNRLVALKMVLAGAHASAEELHRFLDEAEAVAKLRHPHIVQVYDLGIQDNRPFYSMELVEGTNLEQYLADTPQPPDIAARLVALLARAVDYAHQRGIVHRDLKPANILLASGGREPPDGSQLSGGLRPPLAEPVPKITDFGLAKHLDRSVSHTQTGVVMGTPSYMAPEQASGTSAAIGPHTDVYGLGAILYEMLTGRSPFRAETEVETLRLVLETEPVPPRSLQPGVPRDVETICLKCLQKEPAKRYRSAAQLADDLDRFLRGEPIQARPVGTGERLWRWCKRKPVVASLSAALLVVFVSAFAAVTGLWLLAEDRRHLAEQETHKARTSAEEADNQRHNADRNYREVMQQRDREQFQMVRLHLANGARRLEDGDLLAGSVWFTEAFRRDLALDAGTLADKQRSRKHRERLALLAQQCPRLVQFWAHEDGDVCGVSNDARWLLTSTLKGVSRVWDTATGQPVTAAPLNHPNPVLGGYFSPDGKRVLLTSYNGGAIQWEVVTSKQIPLTGLDGRTKVAQFSPDGRYLVTLTGDDVLRWWNLATGQVREAAGRHLGNVRIAISPNSKYVALTANVATWLWDLATGEQPAREPFGQTRGFELVAFSPDGHWIATTAKHWAVEIRSVQGGSPREFSHRGDVRHAEFSPDTGETTPGRGRLLTASNDGTAQVWDLRTGGSAAPAMVHGSAVALARFSPAGRWVATACDDARIRVWDAATGQPVVPPLRHGGRILWIGFRPDGRHLLTLAADRTARVWDLTTGLPGLPLRGHKEKVSFATFSPDQKLVATVSDDRTARLWDARTGQAHTPPLVHAGKVLHASFTPDSKVLVTTSADF